ncbi:NAD(P)-binding protein [Daldinia caldariorum]|uniref:NAD(P)-binding protein n=1 Tax=Daldinia caldariorum TaxID=326644 RepID=UPI00200787C0|nr:NAD(P)-binding protein [Daldinia caldariorum]KAI1471454.1 NAD(P)-binding protein [Daldinia caldariorum]
MPTIAVGGASGKIGGATLSALLAHNLVPASSIIALTSSRPGSSTFDALAAKAPGLRVRHADFEDAASFEKALEGVDRFFLVSTPHVELDFDRRVEVEDGSGKWEWQEVPDGQGRERHHRVAIDAAARAGVSRIYYTSLAFAFDRAAKRGKHASKAGVMRAHLRTEAYLARQRAAGVFGSATAVREGLYAESWPLYLGEFAADGGGRDAERTEVPIAGDGTACWTAIADLGVANALVLAAPGGEFDDRTFYLSTRAGNTNGGGNAKTVSEIGALVGKARGKEIKVKVVGRAEHERYYVEERGLDAAAVRWWVGTYEALEEGECEVDDGTLEGLLGRVGMKPTRVEEVIGKMVKRV